VRESDAEARPPALIERSLASRVEAIDGVVADVVAACRSAGVDDRSCRFTIPLVMTEILANAIQNGNGGDPSRLVRVAVRTSPLGVELEVSDEGPGFALDRHRATPDDPSWLESERGRGLFIISALTERVETLQTPAGGMVRVVFRSS
jgi:anti-sigma regulatory factor (Ser/Thr protein kinase)